MERREKNIRQSIEYFLFFRDIEWKKLRSRRDCERKQHCGHNSRPLTVLLVFFFLFAGTCRFFSFPTCFFCKYS